MFRLIGLSMVAVLAVGLSAWADDEDEKIPLDKVPATIKDAL